MSALAARGAFGHTANSFAPLMTVFNRRHALAAALGLGLVPPARVSAQTAAPKPVRVEGLVFAGEATVGGTPLVLNGVGLRAVAWVKGYAAGLYLARRATSTPAVLATPGAKRLDIRLLLDVSMQEFSKSFNRGIGRNTPAAELPKLKERIDQFDALLDGIVKVKKKDTLTIDWIPASGTVLSLNGSARGAAIAGEDFYAALLRIFIGDKVSDVELKAGLLGGPVS
jgi:Chalcone isomerase-like